MFKKITSLDGFIGHHKMVLISYNNLRLENNGTVIFRSRCQRSMMASFFLANEEMMYWGDVDSKSLALEESNFLGKLKYLSPNLFSSLSLQKQIYAY